MNNADPEMDVELGDVVEAKRGKARGPVVAVRLSPDLFARITEYGSARGLTVSEVVRRGAENLLSGAVSDGAVYYTGSELRGARLIHGSPAMGSGKSTTRGSESPAKESVKSLTAPG